MVLLCSTRIGVTLYRIWQCYRCWRGFGTKVVSADGCCAHRLSLVRLKSPGEVVFSSEPIEGKNFRKLRGDNTPLRRV